MEWTDPFVNGTVVSFLESHAVIIGMLVMFLRGLAKVSPWTWDEKIVECFAAMFTLEKGGKGEPK